MLCSTTAAGKALGRTVQRGSSAPSRAVDDDGSGHRCAQEVAQSSGFSEGPRGARLRGDGARRQSHGDGNGAGGAAMAGALRLLRGTGEEATKASSEAGKIRSDSAIFL